MKVLGLGLSAQTLTVVEVIGNDETGFTHYPYIIDTCTWWAKGLPPTYHMTRAMEPGLTWKSGLGRERGLACISQLDPTSVHTSSEVIKCLDIKAMITATTTTTTTSLRVLAYWLPLSDEERRNSGQPYNPTVQGELIQVSEPYLLPKLATFP